MHRLLVRGYGGRGCTVRPSIQLVTAALMYGQRRIQSFAARAALTIVASHRHSYETRYAFVFSPPLQNSPCRTLLGKISRTSTRYKLRRAFRRRRKQLHTGICTYAYRGIGTEKKRHSIRV